jgi:drug/metabolite transporter (DMT)-like permease
VPARAVVSLEGGTAPMSEHILSIAEARGAERISRHPQAMGYAAGLLAWALSGGVLVAGKGITGEMGPWTLAFWRFAIAALVLAPLVVRSFPEMREFLRRRGWQVLAIGALLGIVLGLLFEALHYTSAVNTGIINATYPIITLVLARIFLGEPLGPAQAAGGLIAFAGVVLIAARGDFEALVHFDFRIGDVLVLIAAATLGAYTVLLKKAKFALARLPLLVLILGSAAVVTFPLSMFELWRGDYAPGFELSSLIILAYIGIPGGALVYLFFNWSIDVLGASRAGMLLYSQMIFTALLAWLILGESIEWYHYVGAALIIVGVAGATLLKPRQARPAVAK